MLARKPGTSAEAAEAADLYFEIYGKDAGFSKFRDSKTDERKEKQIQIEQGYSKTLENQKQALGRLKPICFVCKQEGHKKNECPNRDLTATKFKKSICFICGGNHKTSDHSSQLETSSVKQVKNPTGFVQTSDSEFAKRGFVFKVMLNGRECKALRDTGCNYILFNSALIDESCTPLNRSVTLTGLFGQKQTLPLFNISLKSRHFGCNEVLTPAAAVNDLFIDVIIGNSLFDSREVIDFLCSPARRSREQCIVESRDSQLAAPVLRSALAPGVAGDPLRHIDSCVNECEEINSACDPSEASSPSIVDSLDSIGCKAYARNGVLDSGKPEITTDKERHPAAIESVEYQAEFERLSGIDANVLNNESFIGDLSQQSKLSKFALAQRADPSLTQWFALAEQDESRFVIENGLLFKRVELRTGQSSKLLVVPHEFRMQLLELAHNSPFGGHLGRRKTVDRIEGQGRLTWPRIGIFVREWIARCPACQKAAPLSKSDRVPLSPIPRIPVPFSDVSFDILGSAIKVTPRGNKYLMIHVDNASRYVDIVPLKNMKTDTIIDALIGIWTRVGFPQRARYDQSTANMSKLMHAMRERLGIEGCPSSVYLHHTSGLAERHIKTVGVMVKKFLPSFPRNWDRLIPILQMSINDSVCETTGFTPTELLYGRRVRGPLTILHEIWVNDDSAFLGKEKNVITYLNELRKTLQTASDIAQETTEKQQTKMKRYYDHYAKDKQFVAGQKALLLMPSSPYKMEAAWTGPVTIVRAIDSYSYEVQLENRKQVFHCNMLRPYIDEPSPVGIVISADDESSDEELPATVEVDNDMDPEQTFKVGSQLTDSQQERLLTLLNSFEDVLTSRTGRTQLVEHNIVLKDNKPCTQPPYKIPDALKDQVEAELAKLLAGGFIQESQSSYSAPLLIVKKKQNKIRLVNNFKKLNDSTEDDGLSRLLDGND